MVNYRNTDILVCGQKMVQTGMSVLRSQDKQKNNTSTSYTIILFLCRKNTNNKFSLEKFIYKQKKY